MSCLFCLPPAYLGLFVDLGHASLFKSKPVLSALSGQVFTPAGLGLFCDPEYTSITIPRPSERRKAMLLDHTAVKPVSLCNLRKFCECIPVSAAVTLASLCLTFPLQSEGEIQEDSPCCVFLQEVPSEMEGSQNLDSQPQGSV